MEINEKDTVLHPGGQKMAKLKLRFEDKKGKRTEFSPSDVEEKVIKMLTEHTKEIRETVGRLGELCVGTYPAGEWRKFALGWYMRKIFESYEKEYGKGEILSDVEKISIDQAKSMLSEILKRQGAKYTEMADQIQKGDMDDMFNIDGEDNTPED